MGCNQSNTATVVQEDDFREEVRQPRVPPPRRFRTSNTLNFDETEIERRRQFQHEIIRRTHERRSPIDALSMSRSRSRGQLNDGGGDNLPVRVAFNWGQTSITNEHLFWLRQSGVHFSRDDEAHPLTPEDLNIHDSLSGLSTVNNDLQNDYIQSSLYLPPASPRAVRSISDIQSPSYSFPPASPRAIRKLPTISMTRPPHHHHFCHHEQEHQNKECSICYQEFVVDAKGVRLPCGHMFHRKCIKKWLQQKCTCPVCRWELETSDSEFEHGRIARMKKRHIRLNSIDLEHMTIDELLGLAETHAPNSSNSPLKTSKKSSLKQNEAFRLHLINEIKKSSQVQVVEIEKPASEPLVSDEETTCESDGEGGHILHSADGIK